MSTTSTTSVAKRKLDQNARGVFVPMTPQRLAQLDADRERLGLSRGGALAAIYDNLGSEAVDITAARTASEGAAAEAAEKVVEPLVEALAPVERAWTDRAHQRQRIGVLINQIAKFTNALSIGIRAGEIPGNDDVERIGSACAAMLERLEAQLDAELAEQWEIAAVRHIIAQLRRPS